MPKSTYNSLERVLKAIGHEEADRVPLFLTLSLYGAKELGMPIEAYFASADNIVTAQLQMMEKYRNDFLSSFFYASIETEAWGGSTVFVDEGPPNAGAPVIYHPDQIKYLEAPDIAESPGLNKVLKATRQLAKAAQGRTPVVGVVISPFSLPVMQMGFEPYLTLIYNDRERFQQLMSLNIEFATAWANAQLKAGATAICYFDPLASPTIIERGTYLNTGYQVARETISRISGPTATHLASGATLGVLDDIAATGSVILGISSRDPLELIKKSSRGKICLLGNLNAIDMVNWGPEQAEQEVKKIIAAAGPGGGLILSDNHGEIPWQVPEEVLLGISDAIQRWGQYPLDWIKDYEKA